MNLVNSEMTNPDLESILEETNAFDSEDAKDKLIEELKKRTF